jgi:bifunctional DNA-binding transcriptional regulator/antitoxin component of YhaV-PrlF toxin-antitoxin module
LTETIFESTLTQSGCCTVKKNVRDDLNLEAGDILFLKVIKVLKSNGDIKYDSNTNKEE